MKKIIYILVLCLVSYNLYAQNKAYNIDYQGYTLQYNANRLMSNEKYFEALTNYKKALNSNTFFKYEIQLKMAYCYAMISHDSLAKKTLVKAYNNGFKYWFKDGLHNAWLMRSLKDDSSYLNAYSRILKINYRSIHSDSLCQFPNILDSLEVLSLLDQKYRIVPYKKDSIWKLQEQIDKQNQNYVSFLLRKFNGLPSYMQVGRKGLNDILLISVHANNLSFLKKMISCVEQGLKQNSGVQRSWYAILVDKYSLQKYGYQIFGTQVKSVQDRQVVLHPIYHESKAIINELRDVFRLPTLKEYKSYFIDH